MNAKFSYEIEMLQKHKHPSISDVIDVFEEGEKIYLITPLYEGDDL